MDTFTLCLPRWLILRVFSRNPLLRAVDRVEAVFVLGAVVVSLLAAPFAAAIVGTAVHDARSHLYAPSRRRLDTLSPRRRPMLAPRAQNQPRRIR